MKYYDEKKLLRSVWNWVKSTYYAYDILRGEEINFEDQKVYLVYVENETHYKTIRVTEATIEEIGTFTKA